jgi:hypothetical protein
MACAFVNLLSPCFLIRSVGVMNLLFRYSRLLELVGINHQACEFVMCTEASNHRAGHSRMRHRGTGDACCFEVWTPTACKRYKSDGSSGVCLGTRLVLPFVCLLPRRVHSRSVKPGAMVLQVVLTLPIVAT